MPRSGGTCSASRCGTLAAVVAPAASTTVGACQPPWSVCTRYPCGPGRIEVTAVPVSTGAAESAASVQVGLTASSSMLATP
jgi:hypothetical protein